MILPLYPAAPGAVFWASQYKTRVQQRTTKTLKGLRHLFYEESLKVLGLFILKNKRLREISSVPINTWSEGTKRMEISFCQCCSVQWNSEGAPWTSGSTSVLHRYRLLRETVEPLTSKSRLDVVLGILLWCSWWNRSWRKPRLEIFSNLNLSVILLFCNTSVFKHKALSELVTLYSGSKDLHFFYFIFFPPKLHRITLKYIGIHIVLKLYIGATNKTMHSDSGTTLFFSHYNQKRWQL